MGKSSRELVEHKAKNPVYSEILFRINVREISAYDLAKEFENKSRPTLVKQLQELEKEGYVKRKKDGKKQLFFVNWNKIKKDFVVFLAKTVTDRKHIERIFKVKNIQEYYQPLKTFDSKMKKQILTDEAIDFFLKRQFQNQNYLLSIGYGSVTLQTIFNEFVAFLSSYDNYKNDLGRESAFLKRISKVCGVVVFNLIDYYGFTGRYYPIESLSEDNPKPEKRR
jgi:DNA-binding transcriptional ArsR family regulator